MRVLTLLCVLLLSASAPAFASSTICHFDSESYAFQFIGYGEIAMIQVDAPSGARVGSYEVLDFDERAKRIHIVHSGDEGRFEMPPFVLRGAGDDVLIEVGGKRERGVLRCQWEIAIEDA